MYFVGTGYAVDDLKSLAKDLHIREQLHFPGMIADRNILKDYYAAANLFIFPSLYDTWALVVREAAALYTPSLMIEEATAAKSVTDGFNGYLSKNTPEALSGKLEQLSSDKTKLLRTGVNASKTLTKSWEKVTEEVAERYRQVIEYHQKK